jgi:hypothetical protein
MCSSAFRKGAHGWFVSGNRQQLVSMQGLLSKQMFHDKLDMNAIAAAVSQGLGDDKVIKPTAHALMCRLCKLSPTSVLTHLKESMITPLNKTLSQKLKDDAIPQEVRADFSPEILASSVACYHNVADHAVLRCRRKDMKKCCAAR